MMDEKTRRVLLDKYGIVADTLEQRVLAEYPTILSRSFSRFCTTAEPRNRLERMIKGVFQNLLRHLALLGLSEYCRQDTSSCDVNAAMRQIAKPSYGNWVHFLEALEKHFRGAMPSFCPELASWRQAARRGLAIPHLLDSLGQVKNSLFSHDVDPEQAETKAPELLHRWIPDLYCWLEELAWLARYDLHAVRPDGTVFRLKGVTPVPVLGPVEPPPADLYFEKSGGERLPAFPLFFWLEEPRPNAEPGLYLYNGATDRRVKYLSHVADYQERSLPVVEALLTMLRSKEGQWNGAAERLDAEDVVERAREYSRQRLEHMRGANRYSSELYVKRDSVERPIDYWLSEGAAGLLIRGEAGSGKTMAMGALTERLLRSDDAVVLLQGRDMLDPSGSDLRSVVTQRVLHRPEALETVLACLAEGRRRMVLIVDALEESAFPVAQLLGLFNLLAASGGLPLKLVFTVRDIPLAHMTRQVHVQAAFDAASDRLTPFQVEELGRMQTRPFLALARIAADELETFFERYRHVYDIRSSIGEIAPTSREVLSNPLLLKLACEAYRGQPLPANMPPHRLFKRYLDGKLFDSVTGLPDSHAASLLNRFVRLLLQQRTTRIDINDLEDDPVIGSKVADGEPTGPYQKLLREGILVQVYESDEYCPKTCVRVNFDKLLDVLVHQQLAGKTAAQMAEFIWADRSYVPYQGALALKLLLAGEKRDLTPFRELIPHLVTDAEVHGAVMNAIQNLSYTDKEFVRDILLSWMEGATDSSSSLTAVRDVIDFVSATGRWDLAADLAQQLLDTPAAGSLPDLHRLHLELLVAQNLGNMGEFSRARAQYERLRRCTFPEIRVLSLALLVSLCNDMEDYPAQKELAEECIRLGEQMGDPHVQAYGLWSLGTYFEYTRQFASAAEQYEKVFDLDRALSLQGQRLTLWFHSDSIAAVYRWYGRALGGIPGRILEAEQYYLRCLQMDEESRNLYDLSVDWNNLADYYLYTGRMEKALVFSNREVTQTQLYPNDPEWGYAFFMRSCLLFMLGRTEDALAAVETALSYSDRPEGVRLYRSAGFFSKICILLADKASEEARKVEARAKEDADVLPADLVEARLYVNRAIPLALSLADGTCSPQEVDAMLDEYRDADLRPAAGMVLGLALLPAVRLGRVSPALRHALERLLALGKEMHNLFWVDLAGRELASRVP